jgi:hypothetical protein
LSGRGAFRQFERLGLLRASAIHLLGLDLVAGDLGHLMYAVVRVGRFADEVIEDFPQEAHAGGLA